MRYSSIDCLRTVAIVVMVLVHFAENLSGVALPIAGFGAPLFVFLSGLSYRLWVNGLEAKGTPAEEISRRSMRRGLFVFGVGFGFNILAWLPEDTFNWDVLTFVGTALLLLNLLRWAPPPVSIAVALLSLGVSPLLRELADYPAYWVEGYFDPDLTLTDTAIGFLATGYFPVFPWLTYSIAGLVTGSIMFPVLPPGERELSTDRLIAKAKLPIAVGAGLMTLSALLLLIRPFLPALLGQRLLGGWHMFPPTVEYVCGTIGMASLLFGGAYRLVDCRPRSIVPDSVLDIAKTFSRYSFTIYIVHHLVHLWPMWIYAAATGKETTYYWQQALPFSVSLLFAIGFLVVSYLILRRIGPDHRLGIEGWMRWLCD